MLTANEALKISKNNSKVTEELKLVEKEIMAAAERSETDTYFCCERLNSSERNLLIAILAEHDYKVYNVGYPGENKIYISWRA